jgi:hypothetical protein
MRSLVVAYFQNSTAANTARVSVLVKLDFASIFSGPEAVRWP